MTFKTNPFGNNKIQSVNIPSSAKPWQLKTRVNNVTTFNSFDIFRNEDGIIPIVDKPQIASNMWLTIAQGSFDPKCHEKTKFINFINLKKEHIKEITYFKNNKNQYCYYDSTNTLCVCDDNNDDHYEEILEDNDDIDSDSDLDMYDKEIIEEEEEILEINEIFDIFAEDDDEDEEELIPINKESPILFYDDDGYYKYITDYTFENNQFVKVFI